MKPKHNGPKVLFFDIESSPLLGYCWGLWDQTIALNQIHTDWHVLSWSAKWKDSKEVMYMDQRNAKSIEDDRKTLQGIWKLLDEADIVVTQNGKAFDVKKLNARFVMQGFQPPSTFKHIDTLQIAKRRFGFTSNKLEYMASKLCTKYKKLTKRKFSGFELWKECLAGNELAWQEMEKYNRLDTLVLEELWHKLMPWDGGINFSLYHEHTDHTCECGSQEFEKRGFHYTQSGKFQRYRCHECGAWSRDRKNLIAKDKRKTLRVRVGE